MTRCCAVVLAAGAGRRAGGPKAEYVIAGQRLVDRAIATARAAGCADVIAVVRAGTTVTDATAVVNPDPDRGLSSSLAVGLAAAARSDAGAAIVLLVDMPGLTPAALARIAAADDPAGPRLWFATFAGRRAHPVRIDRALYANVVEYASGDTGAKGFARVSPGSVREVDCDGLGDPLDLDTAVELAAWSASQTESVAE